MPEYKHDFASNMYIDGGISGSGANTLPHKFSDDSILTIPIPVKDYDNDDDDGVDEAKANKPQKVSWLKRRMSAQAERTGGRGGIKMVRMTRGEYLQYWAKGENGKYLDGVVAPPEGRKEWVRRHLGAV